MGNLAKLHWELKNIRGKRGTIKRALDQKKRGMNVRYRITSEEHPDVYLKKLQALDSK